MFQDENRRVNAKSKVVRGWLVHGVVGQRRRWYSIMGRWMFEVHIRVSSMIGRMGREMRERVVLRAYRTEIELGVLSQNNLKGPRDRIREANKIASINLPDV